MHRVSSIAGQVRVGQVRRQSAPEAQGFEARLPMQLLLALATLLSVACTASGDVAVQQTALRSAGKGPGIVKEASLNRWVKDEARPVPAQRLLRHPKSFQTVRAQFKNKLCTAILLALAWAGKRTH